MTNSLYISLITIIGTMVSSLVGILISNRLTTYRIEQLEKKQDQHNSFIQRMFIVETKEKVCEQRINDLEKIVEKLR